MSETLRDLVVSLSLNSDNFTRNIKSINKQIQEAESAFRLASAGVENFETTTAGLSFKLSTLQRTFQLQQDAVGQYERALQQASDKLQECYTRQNDYAQRLADAKDKQQQLKTEVASAAQAYKHYRNTLGETDSATIAAKANLDAYKSEYRAAVQEVKKLRPNGIQKKEAGIEKIRWEKRKQEIDREQHTLYGMMGALMMEKGDGCPEIEVYRQQVFQLTAEHLEINEKLKALEEETSKAEDQERVYKTICEIWNGNFGNEFRKEPIPVQRDKIRQVLQRAEWDGEKLHLFLRGAQ